MKLIQFTFLYFFIAQTIYAQKSPSVEFSGIDKKALSIPDSLTKTSDLIAKYIRSNFSSDIDKSRAIFIWVASNIQYDVDNMYAIDLYEKKEEKIAKSLRTRKGICDNYASLFTDICIKSGLKSYVILGYTKQLGLIDKISHAWCATLIDTAWFLYDPTWGSGYVDRGKFYKKINNDYFKVNPTQLIKSHMPFDYMWQFLTYPVTNQEFQIGKVSQKNSKTHFNFRDTLSAYEQKKYIDQLISSAQRIEKNGIKNSLIFDRLQHIKLEIANEIQNSTITKYNSAIIEYNEAIIGLNEFIAYRNKQFSPKKTDVEIQNMLAAPANKLNYAKSILGEVLTTDAQTKQMIGQLSKSIDEAEKQMNEQQDWLKTYLSKGKSGRKSMFYKVTWFGIPLN